MAQYVTAEKAQSLREKGMGNQVQAGNWIKSRMYDAFSRLVYKADSSDKVGQCIHPTNPKKSGGIRSKELYQAKRNGDIIPDEPVSAHLVKTSMPRHSKVRKIAELEPLAAKVEASGERIAESR